MSGELPFTGERFVPGTRGEIWVEHWHRYHFAARFAQGKRVLDAACGEGYGTALLAQGAAHVTGLDVSEQAIGHAARRYATLGNTRFIAASCAQMPLADASIDVAISFETLEHIREQEAFLDELARVLVPDGLLVLSCPNKLEYSDRRGFANEFHVRELYREELAALVEKRFPHARWHAQRPTFYSVIAPEEPPLHAQVVEVSEAAPAEAGATLSRPLYFLLLASRSAATLAAQPATLSVLSDRDDWVHADYEKVMKALVATNDRATALEAQVGQRDADIASLRGEFAKMRTAIELQEVALRAQQALLTAKDAAHASELEGQRRELERRRGWRWWLKLPLLRLGLLKSRTP